MHSTDVRKWIEAYERSQPDRKADRAHLELDRLGLITRDEDDESDSGLDGQWDRAHDAWEGAPRSRPLDTATRVALVVGAATIAVLAIFFG